MEILLLFLALSILPFFIRLGLQVLKITPSIQLVNAAKRILYFFIVLLILTIILNCFNVYWLGYKTDTIIYCCISTVYYIYYIFFTQKIHSYSRTTLHLLNFLITIPTIILFSYAFNTNYKKMFYNTHNYRVENNERFFSIKAPRFIKPKVYKKMGIIETRMQIEENLHNYSVDSIHNYWVDENKKELVMIYRDSATIKEKRFGLK